MGDKGLNNPVRVVIFDCDGVMFDSREANRAFYNAILARFGKPPLDEADVEVVHMFTAEESVRYLFRDDGRGADAQEYRLRLDYTQFLPFLKMEPDLEEVLSRLKTRYQIALATNRSTTIGTILNLFNLDQYFDVVVSALDVKNPKPHPESVVKILNHFAIEAEEAIYVGDSVIDYELTRNTNVPFIAYKNPHLDAANHISHLRELLTLLSVPGEAESFLNPG